MVSHQETYPPPSRDEIMRNYKERRNWGRWGDDDSVGAINLITVEKRLAALASVQNGRTVSLSRPYPKDPSAINPTPAQHFMRTFSRGDDGDGAVVDYYGFIYHGHTFTHVDALCHIWDSDGIWQGRDPNEAIDSATGATFADVTAWNQGIFTRGVLLDVPKFRGEPYVTFDKPVMGNELQDIADSRVSRSSRATRCWCIPGARHTRPIIRRTSSASRPRLGFMRRRASSSATRMSRCWAGT